MNEIHKQILDNYSNLPWIKEYDNHLFLSQSHEYSGRYIVAFPSGRIKYWKKSQANNGVYISINDIGRIHKRETMFKNFQ